MSDKDLREMADPSRKQNPVRWAWGKSKQGAGWLLGSMKPPLRAVKSALTPQGIGRLTSGAVSFMRTIVAGWTSDRSPEREGAPDIENFGQVLDSWGLGRTDEDIAQCIARLKSRCFYICLMSMLFIASMLWGWQWRVSQFMVILSSAGLCGVALTTHLWRIGVLKRQRFVFFSHWLMGRR